MASAYQVYILRNGASGSTELLPYFNYAAVDTSTIIDDKQTQGSQTCGSGPAQQCLMRYGTSSSYNMGGTGTTNAVWFDIDPDGQYSYSTTGQGKVIEFWLYYNGRISTYGTIVSNTCHGGTCVNPTPAYDPPWFSW